MAAGKKKRGMAALLNGLTDTGSVSAGGGNCLTGNVCAPDIKDN
ncbi:hypothetical protein [Cupriavidus sp. amp6]|nr:hypothetical protein [Cupriavidus sp. amp6]